MQLLTAILVSMLLAIGGASAHKQRDYNAIAASKLVSVPLQCATVCEKDCGWSPLPRDPSESQCSLALQRIVKQPQSCGMKYLSGPARNVYLPIYDWFGANINLVALQFASDNGVGVEIYDAFGNELVLISPTGVALTPSATKEVPSFDVVRTWALNYPTYMISTVEGLGMLAQKVFSVDGQVLVIIISKELNLLPAVC